MLADALICIADDLLQSIIFFFVMLTKLFVVSLFSQQFHRARVFMMSETKRSTRIPVPLTAGQLDERGVVKTHP
jgi:hypothetical protein